LNVTLLIHRLGAIGTTSFICHNVWYFAPYVVSSLITERFNPAQKEQAQTIEGLVGFRGQYTQFYENPTLTGVSFAAGVGLGAISRGAGAVYGKVARIPMADAAIYINAYKVSQNLTGKLNLFGSNTSTANTTTTATQSGDAWRA